MTRYDAYSALRAAFPDRSICIQVDDWHYKEGHGEVIFSVSILPGWNGSECTQSKGKTLESAVQLTLDWKPLMPNPVQVAAEADEMFAGPLATAPEEPAEEEPAVFQQGSKSNGRFEVRHTDSTWFRVCDRALGYQSVASYLTLAEAESDIAERTGEALATEG